MSKYTETLGDVIKKRRLELGLTQSEVAEKTDVDNRTMSSRIPIQKSSKFRLFGTQASHPRTLMHCT